MWHVMLLFHNIHLSQLFINNYYCYYNYNNAIIIIKSLLEKSNLKIFSFYLCFLEDGAEILKSTLVCDLKRNFFFLFLFSDPWLSKVLMTRPKQNLAWFWSILGVCERRRTVIGAVWQRWPKSRLNQTAPSNFRRHFFTVPCLVSRERRELLN